jgi:hypothetical protein
MKALIYGHSQSGGMGLDLEKALKKVGFSVTRSTHVGRNDKWLLAHVKEVPAGPYDRVFLYVGGNSDNPTPTEIMGLVNTFGADRTVAILPPVNHERTKKGGDEAIVDLRAKNMGNFKAIGDSVRTYMTEGGNADFEPDQIHMRPGSSPSKSLAQKILEDMGAVAATAQTSPSTTGASASLTVGVGVVLVLAAALIWRSRRS